jgi:hypothetical protein
VYVYAALKQDADCDYSFEVDGLPRGMVIGSVEIVDCTGRAGNYQWHLAKPERLAKPRKPTGRPQPSFFFAW